MKPEMVVMYSFAGGDFFEEEFFYLKQRLEKLFGEEGTAISSRIETDNNGTANHPFRVLCQTQDLDKIKHASSIPYDP